MDLPNQSDREELLRLFDSGNDYGLMLFSARRWLGRNHPQAPRASVIVPFGPCCPSLRVPIIPDPETSERFVQVGAPIQEPSPS